MQSKQTIVYALFSIIVSVGIAVGIVVLTVRVPEEQIVDLISDIVSLI